MTRSLADLRGSTEPRIWTPPLRELTPQTSLGFMMDEFARDVVGVELLPYQKWLAVHALELAPGLTVDDLPSVPAHEPVLRFERVVVLISRQNGKTMFSQILELFFLYCMDIRLIIGTAQSLSLAQEVMDGVYGMIDENEHLRDPELKYIKGNTQKSVELPMLDAKYITKAMTGGAGRGRSADLLLLDELREQKDWTAWAAIEGTTQARSRALLWCMSNAGDVQSVVLRALRLQAHKELGDPDGIARDSDVSKLLDGDMELGDLDSSSSRAALFEWSAPPKASKDDPAAWVAANPALNYTGLSTVKMAEKAADTSRPEWLFRTEYLCQWPDGALEGPFPPGAWDAGLWRPEDHEGEPVPEAVGVEKVGISMPPTRDVVHVVVAGHMADGRVLVQHVERRAGTEWVAEWLQQKIDAGLVDEIAGQTNRSAVSELLDRLKAQNFPVVDWKGPDLTAGVGRFYDAVCENTFTHLQSDHLDIAAATAVKKTFESGAIVFDLKKSPVDAAPLEAAAAAHWLLTRPKQEFKSAYADRGLLVL